jgi:hypothetical protein
MTPDTVIVVIVIAVATTWQIACLVFIALQFRRMNDKMAADDASIFLQGHQIHEILHEMRDLLGKSSVT